MRILFITDSFPYPPFSGDRIRVYNLLRRVATRNEVWLAAQLETPEEVSGVDHLREFCAGVITAPMKRRHPLLHLPGLIQYALAGIPLEIKFSVSAELVDKLKNLYDQVPFDIVQIEHSYLALYSDLLGLDSSCKRILVFHNISADQYGQIAHIQKNPIRQFRAWLYSASLRRWEPRCAGRFDTCITVSVTDKIRLIKLNPSLNIRVIPNGVDCSLYQPLKFSDDSPALLFIGSMSYAPCADAAVFFCREILPILRSKYPDIQMWIVGKDPSPEVIALSTEGVFVTGRVDDVIPYYQRCKVCVVPLRAGGGTRLKILEAMALNRPVVTTSVGCEGLEVIDGQHILIADDPIEFAEKILQLLVDNDLYEHIAGEGRKLVEGCYDWDIIAQQLLQVYEETWSSKQ